MDRVELTGALTHTAGDAAGGAELVGDSALILVGAHNDGLAGAAGVDHDDLLGADVGAGTTAGALVLVHLGNTVHDVDGVELTDLGAVAQTDAGEGAGLGAAVQGSSSGAGLDALVVVSGLAVLGAALALDHGLLLHSACLTAHDLGNGSSSLGAAGSALVARHAVHDDSLCVVGTACVAAAAAVCAGQTAGNFFDTGVFLNCHELGSGDQNDCADSTDDGAEDNSRCDIHNPVPPLQRHVKQILNDAAKAHEGQAGDRCGQQSDGQALEGSRGITGLHALAHAAEHDHSQHEADACADGTDQSLDVGRAEAQSLDVCAVVIDDQNGDSQNAAVGGDQGQVDAQRVVQRNDILLQEDLDELHQNCNDQNEHDGLQIAQTGGVQNKDLQREGHSRSHEHDEDDSAGHTHSGVKLLGNAQERADAIELHQHVVVDKDHAEEDSSEFDEHLISPPSSDCRCRSSSCARCAHPACLPARHSRPSGRRSRRMRREPES